MIGDERFAGPRKVMRLCLSSMLGLSLTLSPCAVMAADGDPAGSPSGSSTTPAGGSAPDPQAPPAAEADPPQPPRASTESREAPAPRPTGSKPAEQPHKSAFASPAPAASKPFVLTGRIEELCKGTAAVLPLKWKKMEPIRDTSLDAKPMTGQATTNQTTLTARAQQSYPMDFRGNWSGTLTIFNRTFAPARWEFDKAEADKEYRIMAPGRTGQTTLTFYQKPGGGMAMEPCQVIITTTTTMSDAGAGMGLSPQQAAMFGNMQVPAMYALHLGDLSNGTGVTGNQLQSQLMKNVIRSLRSDVIEQQVVTRDLDRNPRTGKTRTGYSESVLRFTRVSSNQLYLQAASVNYANDGKFLTKVILYGTLNRGGASAPAAAFPGMPAFPGVGGAGAGAGNMMDAMRQLQQMMNQMQK